MSLLSELGTKVGAEFKAHRLRIEALEADSDTRNLLDGGIVNGMLDLSTSLSGEDDWRNSPISLRERGRVSSGQTDIKYSPNLNFHWAGKKSRSLYMDSLGDLYYGEYDGNGNPIGNKIADTDGLFLENVNATTLGGISATEYARKSTTLSYQDASTTAHYPYQMKQEANGDLSIGYYNNGWKNALLLNASGISYRDSNSTSHTVYHSGNLPAGNGSGKVLQVVQSELTTQYVRTNSNSTWTLIGLNATITPTSTTSKILIIVNTYAHATLSHNLASLGVEISGTMIPQTITQIKNDNYGYTTNHSIVYTHSPASTSAQPYTVRVADLNNDNATIYINKAYSVETQSTSTITLMEIGA